MTEPAPRPVTATWVKILLALSLAFNLGILGIVAGARMKDGHGDKGGLPRDVSFGPFSEALSRQDRQALREALLSKAPEFRAAREAARAEFDTLLAALRADPFDPDAVREALAAIEQRNASRLELGRTMIETRIFDMAEAERLAFADRMEAGLRTKKRPAP
ncbi:periplasmic heavy metal sensor [Tabrizicola sp.]|uniref:periplasmic heavy metal sensor n=1 Tax=Tabrizicola sp. TaxID=2005166 RepID=UPI00286C7D5B|nr:periplasmic heavy metal sensor [Tabrizicola sp.]